MFNLVFYYDDIVITGGVKILQTKSDCERFQHLSFIFFNMFISTFEGLLK